MSIRWNNALWLEQEIAKIITRQEHRGVCFDSEKAKDVVSKIEESKQELYLRIRPYLSKEIEVNEQKKDGRVNYVKKPFLKSGEYSTSILKHFEEDSDLVRGPVTRISWVEPSITKRQKIADQLLKLGWKPTEFTETGQPKLTDKGKPVDSLLKIAGGVGQLISDYLTLADRQSTIEGYLKNVKKNGRISAAADTCGTNTTRFRHKVVVNVPKAKDSILYGKEMRSLFTASPNYFMIGCDASSLEARIMGHYTYRYDNGEFADELLKGDIHTKHKNRYNTERDLAKGLFYALIYGALPPRIASLLGRSKKESIEIFEDFWQLNKALGKVREQCIKLHNKNGWLPALDGRKVYTRSEHSAMNTLFQSGGSIAVKTATVIADQWIRQMKWKLYQLIHMHDEFQFDIAESLVETDSEGNYKSICGDMLVKSIVYAGEVLNLRVPLDGEYKIGRNWAETH